VLKIYVKSYKIQQIPSEKEIAMILDDCDLQLNSDYSQFYFENNKPKVRENAQGKRAFLTYLLGAEICIHITQPFIQVS
jgi:hypothetical protein